MEYRLQFGIVLLLVSIARSQLYDPWSKWSKCSVACGVGSRQRQRQCSNGLCTQRQTQSCVTESCPEWSEWLEWSPCSKTRGDGKQERQRRCINGGCIQKKSRRCRLRTSEEGPPEYLEWQAWEPCSATCGVGEQRRIRRCVVGLCQQLMKKACFAPTCIGQPPGGNFLPWTSWSNCSETCGGGERRRSRSCKPPANCIQHQAQSCNMQPCDDAPGGKFLPWTSWSNCTETRGKGERRRSRLCKPPANCIQHQAQSCNVIPNDDEDKYRNWGQWSGCSVTCGTGISTRIRLCRVGTCADTRTQPCTLKDCIIIDPDEKYGEWLSWSECDASCGFGFARRERYCRIGDCKQTASKTCRLGPCETDYTEWEDWSECSVNCGSGIATRKRYCTVGTCEEKQQTPCDKPTCATGWEDWSNWQGCHKNCGGGFDYRRRRCKEPLPSIQCPGDDYDYTRCNTQPCVNGTWGEWSDWGDCSKTCGKGISKRMRACELGECFGDDEERRDCNTGKCVQARWSKWSVWSECTVTCGVGEKARTRICINGKHWDKGCFGSNLTKTHCNQPSCETAQWSKWSPWRPCSASCGEGTTNRERTCIRKTPSAPQCNGQSSETNKCEIAACSTSGSGWATWSSWSRCSTTCGKGSSVRLRTCTDRSGCEGQSQEQMECEIADQSASTGSWDKWSQWTQCSVTCGLGTIQRERKCLTCPEKCKGQRQQVDTCEREDCSQPTESKVEWSLWLPWSDCPVTCGSGTQSRSRICSQPGSCDGDNEQARTCDHGPCPKPKVIPGTSKLNTNAGRAAQSDAAAEDVPWHVLLFSDENQVFTKASKAKLGSGSLINNKWVLTSAHIIGDSQQRNPTSIVLVFGVVEELSGAGSVPSHAQFYRAGLVVKHPKFHKRTYDYDLALVRVGAHLEVEGGLLVPDKLLRQGSVQFDSYVSPIALPCISSCDQSRDTTQNGISVTPYNRFRCLRFARSFKSVTKPNCMVSGYSTAGGSTKLRLFSRKLWGTQKCRKEMKKIRAVHKWPRYTGRNVCTDKGAPAQSCSGSSGDPLMKQVQGRNSEKCWVLLGVFTHNWSCKTSNAQFYTDVPELIHWIAKSMA